MNKHTDPKALDRIAKLPSCLRDHVEENDPCWSYCPEGWRDLVEKLHANLVQLYPDYQIRQIKEKFGQLRYYTNIPFDPDGIGTILIHHYMKRSLHTCDVCGEVGELITVNDSFRAVRCDQHSSNSTKAKIIEQNK